jgi:hypothetical protein
MILPGVGWNLRRVELRTKHHAEADAVVAVGGIEGVAISGVRFFLHYFSFFPLITWHVEIFLTFASEV